MSKSCSGPMALNLVHLKGAKLRSVPCSCLVPPEQGSPPIFWALLPSPGKVRVFLRWEKVSVGFVFLLERTLSKPGPWDRGWSGRAEHVKHDWKYKVSKSGFFQLLSFKNYKSFYLPSALLINTLQNAKCHVLVAFFKDKRGFPMASVPTPSGSLYHSFSAIFVCSKLQKFLVSWYVECCSGISNARN